ncbi:Alpha/Beta hydrolase protein [Phaeosphaeriaceae sp. PMI808]|nr:Alpha/Beta hydrolase protein [Phaeosphaeriaceae sp. PMI808]
MVHLQKLGTSISDQIFPTFAHYARLLHAQAGTIRSIPCSTFAYGPGPRHQLDIYRPTTPSLINNRHPVLFFFYGGGFVQGHRKLPIPTLDGLVHANVASFFARKYGYTVVVPDYRLLSHGAKFPSGGEDVTLAVQWVSENVDKLIDAKGGSQPEVDLFLLGNSAGGVHVWTFLLCDDFKETRAQVLVAGKARLRGVISLSVPFSYDQVQDETKREVLEKYFGDVERNGPLALLKNSSRSRLSELDFLKAGTKVLVLNAELDPPDECLLPRDDFVREWSKFENDTSGSQRRSLITIPIASPDPKIFTFLDVKFISVHHPMNIAVTNLHPVFVTLP